MDAKTAHLDCLDVFSLPLKNKFIVHLWIAVVV